MARPTKEPRPARSSVKESAPPPSPRSFGGFSEVTSFLWSVADLLRGDYKQADYGKVILPLTVLRRLDCVLDRSKVKVLAKHEELKNAKHPEGTIGMPLRASGIGNIPQFVASHYSAEIANEAADGLWPTPYPQGIFCDKFVTLMQALFKKNLMVLGARVTS